MTDLDQLMHQARRDVDAAVQDVVAPPLRARQPAAISRVAVLAAAAAMLLVVIGGSTWWVRSQGGDPGPSDVQTTAPPTTAADEAPANEAELRRQAQLESRLASISLDLRTLDASPAQIDVASLTDRHDGIAELAETAEEALRARMRELTLELDAVVTLADEIDLAIADLESKRDAMAATLQLSPSGDELTAIESAMRDAEAQVVAIRAMRDELTARAEQLEAGLSEVYVAIGPEAPIDAVTITHHDYGLRELGLGTTISALASDGADVWASTSLVVAPEEQRDYGLVLHIDGATGELIEQVEVPQPMSHIAPGANVVWLARAGDGALPSNLVARLDTATLDTEIWDVGDLSVGAIAAGDNGLWIAGSSPDILSFFDPAAGGVTMSFELGGDGPVTALAMAPTPQPVLWAATANGRLVRIDARSGEIIGVTETEGNVVDLAVTGAIDPSGASPVWAATNDRAHLVDSDGTIVATQQLDETTCCILGRPGISDGIWLATFSGQLRYLYPGGNDLVASVPFPTDDPDEGGGPAAIAETGLSVWLAQGSWLTEVRFPQ